MRSVSGLPIGSDVEECDATILSMWPVWSKIRPPTQRLKPCLERMVLCERLASQAFFTGLSGCRGDVINLSDLC